VRERGTEALRARRWRPDRDREDSATVRAGQARADPGPKADPPGPLSYGDLLVSQFNPLRTPEVRPDDAKDLDAAVRATDRRWRPGRAS
jgi:hypothetical protein